MKRSAVISTCGKYRYGLMRRWGDGKPCLFIMLNPSTADAQKDDRTIKRCVSFAQSWGYGRLYVGNLFAFRATHTKDLLRHTKANTSEAKRHTRQMVEIIRRENGICIAAWGVDRAVHRHSKYPKRDEQIVRWFKEFNMPLHYIKLTKSGSPSHPLYLSGDLKPRIWTRLQSAV